MMILSMAYSPCPNDTSMFHSIATGQAAKAGFDVSTHLHDIETLNQLALSSTYDVTKVSFHTYLLIRHHYQLLNTGAALGFGCGPLLVARTPMSPSEVAQSRIAIPGELTTAHLLLRLWAPGAHQKLFAPYDRIMELLRTGEADSGILIHESRFVYQQAGLTCIQDLGQWWEQTTGHPIPLGCIVARKTLGPAVIAEFESILRQGIIYSRTHPSDSARYVRENAQEMDATIRNKHVSMFVTDFSVDLGEIGHNAIAVLESMARKAGVIP